MNTIIESRFFQYSDGELDDQEANKFTEKLINEFNNAKYCYLLLDLSLRNVNQLALENEIYAYIEENYLYLQSINFRHPMFNNKNTPSLLPINREDKNLYHILKKTILLSYQEIKPDWLLSGQGRAICGWLFSNKPIEIVSNYLAKLCIQKNRINDGEYLLRLYDPSVLNAISGLFLPQIRDKVFAETTGWFILNGDGMLVCHTAVENHHQIMPYRLGLIEEEKNKIANIGIENQTLLKYRSILRNQPRLSEDQARIQIRMAIEIAEKYQLNDEQDKVLFALHYLTIGSKFYQTPKIVELLKIKDTYYQKRVASITYEQWQEIKQQSNAFQLGESYAV